MRSHLLLVFAAVAAFGKRDFYVNYTVASQWELVSKFCFDAEGGTMNIKFNGFPPGQELLLYHDFEEGGFADVAVSGHDCIYKTNRAQRRIAYNDALATGPDGMTLSVASKYRPRWWFFVVANCDEAADLPEPFTYMQNLTANMMDFTHVNNHASYPHFSKNEEGIYETQIVALVVLMILLGMNIFLFKRQLGDETQKTHQLTFCMIVVVSFEILANIFKIAHWDAYHKDGVGHPSLLDFAAFVDVFPDALMVGLFILLSKGWQISQENFARLTDTAKRSTLEYMILYLGCSIALYAWTFTEGMPYEAKFVYQSPPGYLIVALHCLTCFWFLSNVFMTYRHAGTLTTQCFYGMFSLFGVAYLLILPITIIVAEQLFDWNRTKAVVITNTVLNLITYIFFFVTFGLCSKMLEKDIQESMIAGQALQSDAFNDGTIQLGQAELETGADQDYGVDSDDDMIND